MIYTAIDKWNSSPDSYLEHHGVKGMKWGVRKQPESLGSRYSRWGRNVSNKSYDRQLSRVEARRARKMTEVDRSPVKNTRYGKWVKDVSNKSYDRQKANIEARRAKRMGEFDSFDNARSKISDLGKKSVNFIKDHKKEIAIGAAVVGGAALTFGAYKVHSIRQNNMAAVGAFLRDHDVRLGNNNLMSATGFKGPSHFQEFVRQSSHIKKGALGPTLTTNTHISSRWKNPTIDRKNPVKNGGINWTYDKTTTSVSSRDYNRTIGRGGEQYNDIFLKDKNKYMRRAAKNEKKKMAKYYKEYMFNNSSSWK